MKKLFVALLVLSQVSLAYAQLPETNASLDAEQVYAMSQTPNYCYEPTTEWTCFARDARGGALGVSTSFTRRDLAVGRAIESCRRKSSMPQTCAITSCKQPQVPCRDDDDND